MVSHFPIAGMPGSADSITIAAPSTTVGREESFVMMGFILRAAISALGLWVASQLLDGLHFTSPSKLLVAALLLGIVNAFVRPLAFILTLPITVVTLGLFLLVLNAAMTGLVAWLVPGFTISGFWTAVGASIIVSLVSWAASSVIGNSGRVEIIRGDTRR
jgi:putative membrane protein